MNSRLRRISQVAVAVAVVSLTPETVLAGNHDHLNGFFLRLSAGAGAAQTEVEEIEGVLKMSGAATDMNLAIGGIVTPNLAIHATLFGWLVDKPDIEFFGLSVSSNDDLSLSAFGAGLTYYFMPINIYLSGSVGAGSLSLETSLGTGETDTGVTLDVTLGKEWWVGNRWGIGAAAAFGYHHIPEANAGYDWTGTSLALRFSATLN
jgi:hypothetical protein